MLHIFGKIHDVGKIFIQSSIVNGHKDLTEEEKAEMNLHTVNAKPLIAMLGLTEYEEKGILSHHLNASKIKEILLNEYLDKNDKSGQIQLRDLYLPPKDETQKKDSELIQGAKEYIAENKSRYDYAHLVAVCDCVDTMTCQRGYNNPKHIVDVFRDLLYNSEPGPYQQFDEDVAKQGILLLAKQIASIGYNPAEMVKAIQGKSTAAKINNPNLVNRLDETLITMFEDSENGIAVNMEAEPNAYCELGFRLNEYGEPEYRDMEQYVKEFKTDIPQIREYSVYRDELYDIMRAKSKEVEALKKAKDASEIEAIIIQENLVELGEEDEILKNKDDKYRPKIPSLGKKARERFERQKEYGKVAAETSYKKPLIKVQQNGVNLPKQVRDVSDIDFSINSKNVQNIEQQTAQEASKEQEQNIGYKPNSQDSYE